MSDYMRFVREILCVSEERIRAGIHIYPPRQETGKYIEIWYCCYKGE